MKHCKKCDVALVVGENWAASQAKHYRYVCRECANAVGAKWRKANPDYYSKYRKANPEKIKPGQAKAQAKYRKANPGKINANTAKRRALKKRQTPPWYDHAMVTEIYEVAREFGYEVDHIVPLAKGGLHSHENLQLLTPAENGSKSDSDCWI